MFKPLRVFLRWLYVDKGWGFRPWISWIFLTVNRDGFTFPWNGDEVWWLWPWRREEKPKFVSVGLSGNCSLGDARFNTLKEIDEEWKKFHDAWDEVEVLGAEPELKQMEWHNEYMCEPWNEKVTTDHNRKDIAPDVFGDTDYR